MPPTHFLLTPYSAVHFKKKHYLHIENRSFNSSLLRVYSKIICEFLILYTWMDIWTSRYPRQFFEVPAETLGISNTPAGTSKLCRGYLDVHKNGAKCFFNFQTVFIFYYYKFEFASRNQTLIVKKRTNHCSYWLQNFMLKSHWLECNIIL